jgi:bisphosphoglycerate-dependent phosphoglycerate mutase
MPDDDYKREDSKRWEQQLKDAAARAEEELHRVVTYINDEVVPDIRRNGSQALRAASEELRKLAQRMEDRHAATPPDHPGDKDAPKP